MIAVGRCRTGFRTALAAALVAASSLGLVSCTPLVRYTDQLVDARSERTWFTRFPATLGGTVGFVVGVPVDVAAFVPAWFVYRSQPKETRDPLSVFLFPSFVLWKVGVLVGAPFDLVEWGTYRAFLPRRPETQAERDAIELEWDSRGNFSEYPVTPIYPVPVTPPPAVPVPTSPDG